MTKSRRSVLLCFAPGASDPEDEPLHGQLSAAVQVGRDLWLASDESATVERLSPVKRGVYGAHRSFSLGDLLELPGGADAEVDVEGLDHDGGYLWLVGSHALKRRKANPEKDRAKQRRRLAQVRADGNRYLLARVPLRAEEDGECAPARSVDDGEARTAARLMGGDRGNVLTDALRLDEHLAPFLGLPGKDNGLDIEGLAVRGDRIFLGLRGPVLRGWAVVLEIRVADAAPGLLGLEPLEGSRPYRTHFLDLRGLGVRDLCFHGDDLLLLAGPTMDLDGPAAVYRWRDAVDADEEVLLGRDDLDAVVEVPYGTGEHDACDHPEGLALFAEREGDDEALLVVYDSPHAERVEGERGVRADVFPLD